MEDKYRNYMLQCLSLARIALEAGNPPVGALIVHEGKVIGKGIESGRSTGDITNHAEILAVRDAIANGYRDVLPQACMYTTHEPCITCAYLIRHHRIPDIVYGIAVPTLGGATSQFPVLSTTEVPQWGNPPRVTGDVCPEECHVLNEAFQRLLKKS
nr:nucleoside deaminase [Chitinophaga arvensicola]